MKQPKLLAEPNTCYMCGLTINLKNKSERNLIEIHHIQYKSEGGDNSCFNLVPLCSNHHSLVHMKTIKIDRWYFSTKGWALLWTDENGKEHFGSYTKAEKSHLKV